MNRLFFLILLAAAFLQSGDSSGQNIKEPLTIEVGDWQVEQSALTDFLKGYRSMLMDAKIDAFVDGIGFNVTRVRGASTQDAEKQRLSARWQRVFVSVLIGRGFDRISEGQLRRWLGFNFEEMRRKIIEAQPFGRRQQAEQSFGKEIFMLVKEQPEPCQEGPSGMSALIGAYYGTTNVQSDFGSVFILLTGAGDCGPHNRYVREYVARLKERISARFIDYLERTP